MPVQITAAIHDMNGFGEVGGLLEIDFDSIPEGGLPDGLSQQYYLTADRVDRDWNILDERAISLETAAELTGIPAAEVLQRARQHLAYTNDWAAEYWRKLDAQRSVSAQENQFDG